MNKALMSLLAFSLCLATGASGSDLPDYVRYAEDKDSARLEVAIRTFNLPSGQKVDLIAVVHIADAAYYARLNQRLASYDSVLFELVGDPRALTQPTAQSPSQSQQVSAVGFIQQAASRHLDLSFQLDAIDYTRKNMVHADASAEEFARMQQERGENMLTLFASAMQAQMSTANRAAARELDTFAILRMLMSEDSAREFKKALAKNLDQMEAMTAAMEGAKPTSVLGDRNQIALKKTREVLTNRKQRHVAVFFGGAHMPGIESSLVKDMKATVAHEEWLTAWSMPRAATPARQPGPAP
jgi:hypothetical protein